MSGPSDAYEPPRPAQPTDGWIPTPEPGQAHWERTPVPRPDYLPTNSAERPVAVPVSNVMSSTKRAGAWDVPQHSLYRSLFGSVQLDLRQAIITSPVITIHFDLACASAKLLVPAQFRVELVPDTYLSEAKVKRRTRVLPTSDAPLLRITGTLIMSTVTIVQK